MIECFKRFLRKRKSQHLHTIKKLKDHELRVEKLLCIDNISRAKVAKTGALALIGALVPKVQEFLNIGQGDFGKVQIALILWLVIVFIVTVQYESSNIGKKELITDELNMRKERGSD